VLVSYFKPAKIVAILETLMMTTDVVKVVG